MHARGLTGLVHLIFVLGLLVFQGSGLWCGALPIRPQLESLERLTDTERLQQFTRSLSLPLSLSPKEVKRAVKQAPDRLHLRQDDFLGLGVKRKSVAGVYGTSAGVSLGAAAISYQTMNLRSKNRDAVTKEQSKYHHYVCVVRFFRNRHASLLARMLIGKLTLFWAREGRRRARQAGYL